MQKVYLLLSITLTVILAFQPKTSDTGKHVPSAKDTSPVRWNATVMDFGRLEKDSQAERIFVLTNASKIPLLITDAKWGYSGMLVNYEKTPVMPGQKSNIKVLFRSSSTGPFTKTFDINTTAGLYHLTIKGEVFKPVAWDKLTHDFGDVKQGDQLETIFKCRNGSDLLVFENVMASCGCISPGWPGTAIQPGDSTEIKIIFDTKGKSGMHKKYISVYSNLGLYELSVSANIVK